MRKNKYSINHKPQGEAIKKKSKTLSLDKPAKEKKRKEKKQAINYRPEKDPVAVFLAGTFVLFLLLGVFTSVSEWVA